VVADVAGQGDGSMGEIEGLGMATGIAVDFCEDTQGIGFAAPVADLPMQGEGSSQMIKGLLELPRSSYTEPRLPREAAWPASRPVCRSIVNDCVW
jgi:hypothetical protein